MASRHTKLCPEHCPHAIRHTCLNALQQQQLGFQKLYTYTHAFDSRQCLTVKRCCTNKIIVKAQQIWIVNLAKTDKVRKSVSSRRRTGRSASSAHCGGTYKLAARQTHNTDFLEDHQEKDGHGGCK